MQVPLISNLIARLVSRRVRELEMQIAVFCDCVADGITDKYGSFVAWRNVAEIILESHGVWSRLRDERR